LIARIWRGWTRSWDADAYAEHLRRAVLPRCREAPGNEAAYLLRRGDGDRTEFTVLTLWRSLDAIRAFAGDDLEQPLSCSGDEFFPSGVRPSVTHYEVVEER
jgi:heme-degrading monooxygenase HmoA